MMMGVVTNHQFIMPTSKVDYYDGSDVYLKIPSQLLSIFEVENKINGKYIDYA